MRAFVDGEVQRPAVSVAQRLHRAEQALELVFGVLKGAELDGEAAQIVEIGVGDAGARRSASGSRRDS